MYSAGAGVKEPVNPPVVAFNAYTVPAAVFVAKYTLPSAYITDAWTGPFGVKDHFWDPFATANATTRPPSPNVPPATKTVSRKTAGDEMPASTATLQSSVPFSRSIA